MDTLLPTQPGTYWQLIKASLKLYKASFSRIIILSLLFSCIVFIPRLLSDFIGQNIFQNMPLLNLHRLWLLCIDLGAMIFLLGMFWRMHCVIINKHEPFIDDFKVAIKKLFYVFIASLIQAAIIIAIYGVIIAQLIVLHEHHLLFINNMTGMLLTTLIITGQLILILYVATLFIFLTPLIAIENKGILHALERSALLAWNHWWRIYSVQMTPWLTYLILLLVIQRIIGVNIHIYFTQHPSTSLLTAVFQLILFTFYMPWFIATLLVQLKDLELRKNII